MAWATARPNVPPDVAIATRTAKREPDLRKAATAATAAHRSGRRTRATSDEASSTIVRVPAVSNIVAKATA